jgi:hypothetical protein
MRKDKVTERIKKVYDKYRLIDTDTDLKKHKLTLYSYHCLERILDTICNRKSDGTWTIHKEVADWCKRNGLIVDEPHGDDPTACINYWISAIKHTEL